VALALADPQQGGLGIAADGRLHQLAQSLQQAGLRLHRWLASPARAADATAEVVSPAAQFGQAAADGATRDTGRRRHCGHAAAARRPRLAGREQTPPPFVQERRQRLEAGPDARDIDHPSSLDTPGSKSHRYPAPSLGLLARLIPPRTDSVVRAQALS
jgi:DNA segregation ATPase FtsK/SpoIIIE-like protein